MMKYKFTAKGICSEFKLTEIGKHYGITKKIKWEEPLVIRVDTVTGKAVYMYHFGVVVFINHEDNEMVEFIREIKNIPGSIKSINEDIVYGEVENYVLIEDPETDESELEFQEYRNRIIKKFHVDMAALVLAKSVALEIIELNVDRVFDDIEGTVVGLKSGRLISNEKKTIAAIGKILSFKHTTISYIMMLDKPSITWKEKEAEGFFNEMADLYELDDRYEKLNSKIDALLDTAEVIADLQHSRMSKYLEIVVILLILIEVVHAFEGPIMSFINGIFSFF